jgi:hypothetical protein
MRFDLECLIRKPLHTHLYKCKMACPKLAALCLISALLLFASPSSSKSLYSFSTNYGNYRPAQPYYNAIPARFAHRAVPAVPVAHYADEPVYEYREPENVAYYADEPAYKQRAYEYAEPEAVVATVHYADEPAYEQYAEPEAAVAAAYYADKPAYKPYAEPEAVAAPTVHATQYHAQDELGNVEYGYSNPSSRKTESRDAHGNVRGAYSYFDAAGVERQVHYVADEQGFRVTGANNLPLAPLDTPEVMHARAAHFEALAAARRGYY